ncbi:MAG: oxidoreductase, partial [Stutzerimonas stutzeri]
MSGRLAGRKAFILGAAPGNVGAAIARAYADEGADIVIAGRREDAVRQVADEVGTGWQLCDITDEASIDRAVTAAADTMGGIDIGVNTVGWGLLKPFLDTDKADLDRMAAVQFTGPFQLFQALLRA